jgi:hypothetical protein
LEGDQQSWLCHRACLFVLACVVAREVQSSGCLYYAEKAAFSIDVVMEARLVEGVVLED